MSGFLLKILAIPVVMVMLSYLAPQIVFTSFYQPIILGVIIALAGHMAEVLLLKRGTLWISTIGDFFIAALLAWFLIPIFTGATITLTGALIVGLVIATMEYFVHLFLVSSGRMRKSET